MSLFPLPLTPFENYYWLDDRPEYPTVFPLELRFDGRLDRATTERALAATLNRHPLLRVRIDTSGRWPQWIEGPADEPRLDWADDSQPIAHPRGEFIDLRGEGPLRVWVRASERATRLVFQFHHACCDGLASLLVAQDFLAHYRLAARETGAEIPPLDKELLRRRGDFVPPDAPKPPLWRDLHNMIVAAWVWARLVLWSPAALALPASKSAAAQDYLAFERETLSVDDSARLRAAAQHAQTTVNDLLVRDVLLAIGDWQQRQGARRGWIRLTLPVSIRFRGERMTAANRIGFGFVTRRRFGPAEPAPLLRLVNRETRRIKNWKLALYFLGGLQMASGLPGVVRWALRRDKSFATMVVSNVGRYAADPQSPRDAVWTCGDVSLDTICGVPPVRPGTHAAALAIDYAARYTICLRTDPREFDADQSRALFDLLITRVRATLAAG